MKLLSALLGLVGQQGLRAIAHALTLVAFSLFGFRRRLVLANIATAFPKLSAKEREAIGRSSYFHFFLSLLEFIATPGGKLADTVVIEGGEQLRELLKEGRGVYILSCHIGNWEALAAAIGKNISEPLIIAKRVGSEGLNRFVSERRAAHSYHTAVRKKKGDGFAAIKAALGEGKIIGFMIDQARPGEPNLPFFGEPAKTNTSLAAIWRRCPAPIISAAIHRLSSGGHCLRIGAPLVLERGDDEAADVLAHSLLFNQTIEALISAHPDEYLWLHNRWKK